LAIIYNDEAKSITIDDEFKYTDPRNTNFKVGYLQTKKSGSGTLVDGKVYLSQTFLEGLDDLMNPTNASGRLVFWNESGEVIDRAEFSVPIEKNKDQIVEFHATVASDVTRYSAVSLQDTFPFHFIHFSGYWMTTNDSNNQVKVGIGRLAKTGDYTVGTLQIGHYLKGLHDIDAEISFKNESGEVMGTGRVIAPKIGGPLLTEVRPIGLEVSFIVKGDVTKYKDSFVLKVNSITPSKES
jgi:hypothetical protein